MALADAMDLEFGAIGNRTYYDSFVPEIRHRLALSDSSDLEPLLTFRSWKVHPLQLLCEWIFEAADTAWWVRVLAASVYKHPRAHVALLTVEYEDLLKKDSRVASELLRNLSVVQQHGTSCPPRSLTHSCCALFAGLHAVVVLTAQKELGLDRIAVHSQAHHVQHLLYAKGLAAPVSVRPL